jgi:hypothetical protein
MQLVEKEREGPLGADSATQRVVGVVLGVSI